MKLIGFVGLCINPRMMDVLFLSSSNLNLLATPCLAVRRPLRPRRLLLLFEGDQREVGVAQGEVHRREGSPGAEGPAGRG